MDGCVEAGRRLGNRVSAHDLHHVAATAREIFASSCSKNFHSLSFSPRLGRSEADGDQFSGRINSGPDVRRRTSTRRNGGGTRRFRS